MGTNFSKQAPRSDDDDKHVYCMYCKEVKRVTFMSQIQRGMHICKGGANGLKHKQRTGTQKSFYSHHALVTQVKELTEFKANVQLIHFCCTKYNNKIEIRKTDETFDLNYDEIYIVEYKNARFDPDESVKRAEEALKQQERAKREQQEHAKCKQHKHAKLKQEQNGHKTAENQTHLSDIKYKILAFNCEHFVSWCIVGGKESFQVLNVQSLVVRIGTLLVRSASKLTRFILKFAYLGCDDIALISTLCTAVPAAILGASALLYIGYAVYVVWDLFRKQKYKQICHKCFNSELWDLFIGCGAFLVFSVLSFLIIHFLLHLLPFGAQIPVMILLVVVSAVLIKSVREVRKKFKSPFRGSRNKIESLREIKKGDIISVHGRPVVVTEAVKDLAPYFSECHDAWNDRPQADAGNPREDRRFNNITSRLQTETFYFSTDGYVEGKDIIDRKGTLVGISYSSNKFFGPKVITEEPIVVDLHKKDLYRLDYSNYSTFEPNDVVERARQRIGEKKWSLLSNRSCHFCHWAKVNPGAEMTSENSLILPLPAIMSGMTLQQYNKMDSLSTGIAVTSDNLNCNAPMPDTIEILQAHSQLEDSAPETLKTLLQNEHTPEIVSKFANPESNCPIQSSVFLRKFDARIPSEVTKGDAVEVNDKLGICVEVGNKGQMLTIDIVYLDNTPFNFTIKQEQNVNVNLLENDITILRYHPVRCYGIDRRVRRAREVVGQKSKYRLKKAFVTDCSIREEVHPGDVVDIKLKSSCKKGICVQVSKLRGDFKFKMGLVYIGDSVIEQTSIEIDLMNMDLWIHRYESPDYCRNSADVVIKAESLIGKESKFWTEDGFIRTCLLNEELFVQRGDVLFLKHFPRTYRGICVNASVSSDNEHVLELDTVYKSKLHRHIQRSTLSADLRKDYLQVYKREPKHCDVEEIVVQRAKKMTQKTCHFSKLSFIYYCISKGSLDPMDVPMHDKLLHWNKGRVKCTGFSTSFKQ